MPPRWTYRDTPFPGIDPRRDPAQVLLLQSFRAYPAVSLLLSTTPAR
jgi:hypothetical protein